MPSCSRWRPPEPLASGAAIDQGVHQRRADENHRRYAMHQARPATRRQRGQDRRVDGEPGEHHGEEGPRHQPVDYTCAARGRPYCRPGRHAMRPPFSVAVADNNTIARDKPGMRHISHRRRRRDPLRRRRASINGCAALDKGGRFVLRITKGGLWRPAHGAIDKLYVGGGATIEKCLISARTEGQLAPLAEARDDMVLHAGITGSPEVLYGDRSTRFP